MFRISIPSYLPFASQDFSIPEGQITVLLGASGVGKTTLIHALQDTLTEFSYHAQALTLIENESVFYNLTLFFKLTKKPIPYEKCIQILKDINLAHAKDQAVKALSQGMKQRLNLAMVLLQRKKICFLDEPFSAQDPFMRQHLYAVVRSWTKGSTVIVVTHHVSEACYLSANLLSLKKLEGVVYSKFENALEKIPRKQVFDFESLCIPEIPILEPTPWISRFFLGGGLLAIWHIVAKRIPSFLLPAPLEVIEAFVLNYKLLAYHFAFTLIPLISGIAFASILSAIFGFCLYPFSRVVKIIEPYLVIIQSVPVFLILPLLLYIFGVGLVSKIIAMSLTLFFPCFFGIIYGLKATPSTWCRQKKGLNVKEYIFLWYIRLPYAKPYIYQGYRLCLIHGPLTALAVDWIGATSGLGYLIMLSHGQLELPLMFAGLLLVVMLSVGLDKLAKLGKP